MTLHIGALRRTMPVLDWHARRGNDMTELVITTREGTRAGIPLISGSAYVNHLAGDERPEKVRASFGANYERLSALKRQHDPMNVFRLNANIVPASL
jgi:hypothetical protein